MEFDWNVFVEELWREFETAADRLDKNYRKIYTSRINPDLFGGISVEAYGSEMKLQELANLHIPSARTIVIKPYDVGIMNDIVKAIQKHHPEFSPIVQSDHLKIVLNPPTEESRKRAVKEAKEHLEHAKDAVRHVRRNFLDRLKKQSLPEDQEKRYVGQIDGEIKKMNGRLEEMFGDKEKELMTI